MKRFLLAALTGATLLGPQTVAAEVETLDPVVVTATRVPTPLSAVGSSVTVITAEQIEARQAVSLIDVLRGVPGIDVVRQGGLGQQASVFLRGANSGHTLVMIDGIEVNDPSNPARALDFATLPVDNIERIEIVQGPGSTLYGSDAMGGVIHVITRRGSGIPSAKIAVEAGRFATRQGGFTLNGDSGRFNYALAGTILESDGISAAGHDYGNHETDGFNRQSVSARFGLTPMEGLSFDLFVRTVNGEADLDNFAGTGGDDPNNTLDSRAFYGRVQGNLALFDDRWEQTLGFSLTDYGRDNDNPTDSDHPFDSTRTRYDSRVYKADWQHTLRICPLNTLTVGAEYEKEESSGKDYTTFLDWASSQPASSSNEFGKETARTVSVYLQDQLYFDNGLNLTLGARLDDHSRFGSKATYRATASYLLPATGTRIKGAYGTAFKSPTLAQLYENSAWVSGNRDLDPEKSKGWEIGFEQALADEKVILGATWFANRFDRLITTRWNAETFKYEYENIDEAESYGAELTLVLRLLDNLALNAAHTYTETEDRETGDDLVRRPRHKTAVNLAYRLPQGSDVNIEVIRVGSRKDYDSEYPWPIHTLAAYTVVNLAGSWQVTEQIKLTGRVDNLFDEEYEEVSGYGTPGIAGYLGVAMNF